MSLDYEKGAADLIRRRKGAVEHGNEKVGGRAGRADDGDGAGRDGEVGGEAQAGADHGA